MNLVRWINENPGGQPDERGYWRSVEGRFYISPCYRHTTYPDSYQVTERAFNGHDARKTMGFNTVRECKAYVESLIQKELEKDQ